LASVAAGTEVDDLKSNIVLPVVDLMLNTPVAAMNYADISVSLAALGSVYLAMYSLLFTSAVL
jgi:hypothetical protein